MLLFNSKAVYPSATYTSILRLLPRLRNVQRIARSCLR